MNYPSISDMPLVNFLGELDSFKERLLNSQQNPIELLRSLQFSLINCKKHFEGGLMYVFYFACNILEILNNFLDNLVFMAL